MVLLRSHMVRGAATTLARAATIATRYTTVRRQFKVPTSRKDTANPTLETQVINYPMVQARLFPMIAQIYAILAAGNAMSDMYNSMLSELMKGDISSLAEVHAISSGLKSTCTTIAATGVEDCRKLMGGHGYSYFSGISHIWSTYVPSNTYEVQCREKGTAFVIDPRFLLTVCTMYSIGRQLPVDSAISSVLVEADQLGDNRAREGDSILPLCHQDH